MSAGSSPAGIAATRSRSFLLPATRCARSIASAPGPVRVERQHHLLRVAGPACLSCSGVIAVPITATASSIPAWWAASTSV